MVSQSAAEMSIYDQYEGKLQAILKSFSEMMLYDNGSNSIIREQLKELFSILMALMSCMRSANIHSMLPGDREYTKQFSPSRAHLCAIEERPKACVC